MGLIESDPEYQLIVEANNIAVEVDGEIGRFCKFYYATGIKITYCRYLYIDKKRDGSLFI